MPRYFIDVQDGCALIAERIGSKRKSFDLVRLEAINAVRDLAARELPDGEPRRFTTVIRDEHGTELYQAALTFEGRRLEQSS